MDVDEKATKTYLSTQFVAKGSVSSNLSLCNVSLLSLTLEQLFPGCDRMLLKEMQRIMKVARKQKN